MIIEENVYVIVETNLNILSKMTLQTFVEKLTVYHKMSVLNCLLSPLVKVGEFLLKLPIIQADKVLPTTSFLLFSLLNFL